MGRSWADLGPILGGLGGRRMGFRLWETPFCENHGFFVKQGLKTRLGSILGRLGSRQGLLGTKLGSKRGRKSEAKKGLVLGGLGGGMAPFAAGSL